MSLPFVDLDDRTVGLLKARSVAEAWREVGEAGFRRAEVEALGAALKVGDAVVALGGGTPTARGALELIRGAQGAGAMVLYLRASAASLRARLIGQMDDRPSLTGADPLAEIEAVLARRDPAYLALADAVVNVDGLSEAEAAAAVVAAAKG
jgi:shikimate kinase